MIKKIFFGIITVIILLFVSFLLFVQKDNPNAKVENKTLTHEVVLNELKNEKVVLFVLNSQCEGCNSGIEFIKKDIQYCKSNNIKYLIIFDEIINNNVDLKIKEFKKRNNFNEDVYLIDPALYKSNIGIIASKRRLVDFLSHFVPDVNKIILGYPQYFYFKDGHYRGNSFYDLEINSKKYL